MEKKDYTVEEINTLIKENCDTCDSHNCIDCKFWQEVISGHDEFCR